MLSAPNRQVGVLGVVGLAALLCTLAIGVLPAHATTGLISCTATLTGANEVPPATTAATGSITYTFDPNTSTSTWTLIWSGLTAPATAAHVHAPAPPGSSTGVQVPFAGIAAATSGTFTGSTTTIVSLTPTALATALLGGNAYANIHTSTFPGGEIRGWLSCTQASGVPEFPLGLGALAVAALLVPMLLVLRRTSIRTV